MAVMLVAGASVCLIGFSGPLIRRWMGPGFDGSVAPFVVLALAGVIIVSQAASSNVLIAVSTHRLVAWIWIGEAVANLSLSVWLVRTMGLVGVAVGTFIPFIVGHGVVMLTVACRKVGVSRRLVPVSNAAARGHRRDHRDSRLCRRSPGAAARDRHGRAHRGCRRRPRLSHGLDLGRPRLNRRAVDTRREARALARTLTSRRRDTTAAVSTVPGQEA